MPRLGHEKSIRKTMTFELLSLVSAFLFIVILYKRKQWQRLPPGPIGLPIVGHLHLLGPLIHRSFHKLSSRYGPIVYLKLGSVPCVVVSDPEITKQFLKTQELTFSSRMRSKAIERLTYSSTLAFSPYGPYWRFIKKISTSELLGTRMLNQFLPIRTEELREFLKVLYRNSQVGQSVNVSQELLKMTSNVISQMMLGIRPSSQPDGQSEVVRTVVREVTKIFGQFNVSDFIWLCKNFDLQGFGKRIDQIYDMYDGLLETIITDRQQVRHKISSSGVHREANDFIDLMFEVMEDESSEIKITRDHIKGMVMDFFTAGTDTTAITVDWALAELINHPKVLANAREEINRVVGDGRLVHESDGPNLPYIQAIVKEIFRLHPPVPTVARISTEECKIHNYTLPARTLLFVNSWSIGRDPKYWENPLEFQPERFLDGRLPTSMDVRGQHFQLLPFGTGRRICPGIPLAMQLVPTTLAALIQCFDWRVMDPNGKEISAVDLTELPGLTAPRANELVCVPVARVPLGVLDP